MISQNTCRLFLEHVSQWRVRRKKTSLRATQMEFASRQYTSPHKTFGKATCKKHLQYEFYPNRSKNVENMATISVTSLSRAWLSMHRFSWNNCSETLSKHLHRFSLKSVTHYRKSWPSKSLSFFEPKRQPPPKKPTNGRCPKHAGSP